MYPNKDFYYELYSTELYHHGILGQKWGVRRGKNYPLSENQHSPSEKKAGWKQSLEKAGSAIKAKAKATADSISEKHQAKKEEKAKRKEITKENTDFEKAVALTDAELKQRIERMRNEDTYNALVAKRTAKPDSFAKKLINDSLTKAAEATVNEVSKAISNQTGKMLDKLMGKQGEVDVRDILKKDEKDITEKEASKAGKYLENLKAIRKYQGRQSNDDSDDDKKKDK